MKLNNWRTWLGVGAIGLASILPAHAAVLTFEDVTPAIFSGAAPPPDDSIVSEGFRFTSDGFGLSGVDSSAGFFFGNAPPNADGQFMFMLNNDGVFMEKGNGEAFFLNSFDLAFLAPVPGIGAGASPGLLTVAGLGAGGQVFTQDFDLPGSNVDGDFPFAAITDTGVFDITEMFRVYFFACLYQQDGSCSVNPLDVPAQFALDNIDVPEPGAAVLALTALGLLTVRRKRNAA